MLENLKSRLAESVDFAALYGLLKAAPGGGLVHAPFALTPCPIDPAASRNLAELSLPFNRLAHAISGQIDFLAEALEEVVGADPFTRDLLEMARNCASTQQLYLQITRSDYFLQARQGLAAPVARQVELNTISASYPALAARVNLLHKHLLSDTPWEDALVANDPLPDIVEGFAQAFRMYGHQDACVVMVVQAGEANVFDQRILEQALHARHIPVVRLTLEAIAEQGSLREGHLTIGGRIAAITYFRAGYTPDDFRSPEAMQGRKLVESSSTIPVPNLATHLAGTKKVQQLLTQPATLRRFCEEHDAALMEACFAGMYSLDEAVAGPGGPLAARKAAAVQPERFVLKPQREGGGNNLYDEEMIARLAALGPGEDRTFVLMERITPIPHDAVMVLEGKASAGKCLSEIGRFGVLLANGKEILLNKDAGYLVRTKHHQVKEGGVSAGYGHLDSLIELPLEEAYRPV
ncbi:MAG: glutathione synthase [SAR324 cluster bacterium]|nr:glutathione synthase [SAR324 cluster bacterium]